MWSSGRVVKRQWFNPTYQFTSPSPWFHAACGNKRQACLLSGHPANSWSCCVWNWMYWTLPSQLMLKMLVMLSVFGPTPQTAANSITPAGIEPATHHWTKLWAPKTIKLPSMFRSKNSCCVWNWKYWALPSQLMLVMMSVFVSGQQRLDQHHRLQHLATRCVGEMLITFVEK